MPGSARADVPGTLFVAQLGSDVPTVQVVLEDIDVFAGPAQEICSNNIDSNAQGEIRVATLVLLQTGRVVLTATALEDHAPDTGDGDPFVDPGETIDVEIFLSNKTGVAISGVQASLASNDLNVDCITDTVINFGVMAVAEERSSGSDGFTFRVSEAVERTSLADVLTAEFTISIWADEFEVAFAPQTFTLDLDLDDHAKN